MEAKMDKLPVELYQEIFEYLEFGELFDLRLVNKRLNGIISLFRVKELIFENGHKYRYNWSFSRQPINYLNVLPNSKQFILRDSWFDTCGLRSLKISLSGNRYRRVKLSHINSLVDLSQLEIDANVYDPEDRLLVLPHLKTLSFSISDVAEQPGFVLDLPKLERLNLDCSMRGLTFKHPQSVRQLKVERFESMLSAFRNVQRFECFHFNHSHLDDKKLELFAVYPQLNELLVECDAYGMLDEVIAERDRLERHEAKLYYRSLECLNSQELRMYKKKDYYLNCFTLDQHFRLYQRLADDLYFVDEMDFGKLIKMLGSVPQDFFDKYINIQKLFVRGWANEHLFLTFIGNCRNLGFLSINNAPLSQTFYDRLPAITRLRELHIEDSRSRSFDLSFVLRMESLQVFNTNLELTTNQIRKLCGTQAEHLDEVAFAVNRNLMHVERTNEARYCLKNEYGVKQFNKEVNLESLIAWLKYLKRDEKITRSKFKRMRKC